MSKKADVRFPVSRGWVRFEGRRLEEECEAQGEVRALKHIKNFIDLNLKASKERLKESKVGPAK